MFLYNVFICVCYDYVLAHYYNYVCAFININCFYCKPNCAYTVPEKFTETMIASDCVRMLVNFVCRVASVGYNDRCVADHRTCSFSGGLAI